MPDHLSVNRSGVGAGDTAAGSPIPNTVRARDGHAIGCDSIAIGWLQGESAWGRPEDVLVLPDGSPLVADDHAGAIYRIT
jgi:glucose/arabinose dehydrogenase